LNAPVASSVSVPLAGHVATPMTVKGPLVGLESLSRTPAPAARVHTAL
jgi:hypothetical protein